MKTQSSTYTEKHQMYGLFPIMARTAIVCVVPKLVDAVHDALFKPDTNAVANAKLLELAKKKKKSTTIRKKVDTTQFTQEHFDIIQEAYQDFLTYNNIARNNGQKRKQQVQLVNKLNAMFGLTKSVPTYYKIWSNKIERSSLNKASKPVLVKDRRVTK